MISYIVSLLVGSPFYPHWLESRKNKQANEKMLHQISGYILEVGAGDGHRKNQFLDKYSKIKKYIATDFAEWDDEFTKIDSLIQRFGKIVPILLGYHERIKLDKKCDAMELPFAANSFNYHLSFETLEHISNPDKYFGEAERVLKKGGYLYLTVPFLYRMHGGEPEHRWDFFRYGFGSFYMFANMHDMTVISLYSNTGFGTTMASLTNQFIIRRLAEGNLVLRVVLCLISPIIFLLANSIGYILDLSPDVRFSTRFHVLMKKNK